MHRFSSGGPSSEGTVGGLATIAGVNAGLFLLFGPTGRYETATPGGGSESGTTAGRDYLFGAGHADPALFFWSVFVLGLSFVGGYGVWVGDRYVVLATGVVLLALSGLGDAEYRPARGPGGDAIHESRRRIVYPEARRMTPAACSRRIAPESPATAKRHGKVARPLRVEHRREGLTGPEPSAGDRTS
jgi:hypothetical protein